MVAHNVITIDKLGFLRRRSSSSRILFVLACLLVSCGEDAPTNPEHPHTIENLLSDWEESYRNGDIGAYASVLSDDFTFLPDPADKVFDPNFPESWGRDYERLSLTNLHGFDNVQSLTLRVTHVSTSEPDLADGALPLGTMKVVVSAQLEVIFEDPDTGEKTGGIDSGGQQWLFLRRSDDRIQAGEPMWELFEWREHAYGFGATSPIVPSWGLARRFFEETG